MKRTFVPVLVTAALAFCVMAAPVTAQADTATPAVSARKAPVRHHAKRPRRVQSAQIACTVFGCHPISSRCHPTTEYNFWGNPTGFDAVACR
ncbi:MAG TPA: hypothetical protein VHV58_04985 [Pseudolabrys sp.]|jgi:hypothetical protein|nr:hypothetical protein [Pseudolabrys sp.]